MKEQGIAESVNEVFSVHDEQSPAQSSKKKGQGNSTVNMGSVVPVARKPEINTFKDVKTFKT